MRGPGAAPPSAGASRRWHLLLQALLAVVALLIADQIARGLGLREATGQLCLATLAVLVICARLGWRQAALGLVGLVALTIPAVLSRGDPLLATIVLAGTALGLGISARWRLQQVYWLLVVSLCLLITNSPFSGGATSPDLLRLAIGLLVSAGLAILLQSLLLPPPSGRPAADPFPVAHSWRRSLSFGLLLASTTMLSAPIALQHHWHTNGLWLILTPFLVLRPFVREAWTVALHRALGTVAGVLLVMLLALLLPPALPLQGLAIALGVLTILIATRHGHPALMLMTLTATIVLFNSSATDLLQKADQRLQANAIGIGIALGVMLVAHPIERQLWRRRLATSSAEAPADATVSPSASTLQDEAG